MNLVNSQISGQNRNEVKRLIWISRRSSNLSAYLFWEQLAKKIDDKIHFQVLDKIRYKIG